jgi:hypothetical protein
MATITVCRSRSVASHSINESAEHQVKQLTGGDSRCRLFGTKLSGRCGSSDARRARRNLLEAFRGHGSRGPDLGKSLPVRLQDRI